MTYAEISKHCSVLDLYLDTSCQYGPHLRNLDPQPLHMPRCLVPWFHAKGHNMECQLEYSGVYQVNTAPRVHASVAFSEQS